MWVKNAVIVCLCGGGGGSKNQQSVIICDIHDCDCMKFECQAIRFSCEQLSNNHTTGSLITKDTYMSRVDDSRLVGSCSEPWLTHKRHWGKAWAVHSSWMILAMPDDPLSLV